MKTELLLEDDCLFINVEKKPKRKFLKPKQTPSFLDLNGSVSLNEEDYQLDQNQLLNNTKRTSNDICNFKEDFYFFKEKSFSKFLILLKLEAMTKK